MPIIRAEMWHGRTLPAPSPRAEWITAARLRPQPPRNGRFRSRPFARLRDGRSAGSVGRSRNNELTFEPAPSTFNAPAAQARVVVR
jgi:hypothetical protein